MLEIHAYQKQQVEQGIDTPYAVQFLLQRRVDVDRQRVLEGLRRRIGNVDAMDPSGELAAFAFLDHLVRYQEGMIPVQCMYSQAEDLENPSEFLEPSLSQTWDWQGVDEIVKRCTTVITVTDLLAGSLNRAVRLQLVHNFVLAFLDVVPVTAVHWLPSQRILNPVHYREAVEKGHPLFAAPVNVRMFRVEGSENRIMDTMGLRGFALPDLQCHFRNIDPMRVGMFLFDSAELVFEKGDVIKTGDTIQGLEPGQKFPCSRETAIVEPSRLVLDIQLGEFAASQ